jgi:poly-beta-1,6-N-acetyl-D-glucosamine biosynthesis protein PgaD
MDARTSPAPIINLPHLLGLRQRIGALLFSLACWLYFLIPVAILGGWLAGFRQLANEVVALGGWKRFQYLMDMSGHTILILLAAWLVWTVFLLLQPATKKAPAPMVDDATLAQFFDVDPETLAECRKCQVLTIHFEDDGAYRKLEPGR